MKYHYCPLCGAKLTQIAAGDDGFVPYCSKCQRRWFDTFSNCVLVLVANEEDEIALLWQRHLTMEYGSFVSGFMTPGENAEEAACREVKEELGLDIDRLEYAGTYWFGQSDMLMHGFIGFSRKQAFKLSPEVDLAQWVPVREADQLMYPESPMNYSRKLYQKFLQKEEQRV